MQLFASQTKSHSAKVNRNKLTTKIYTIKKIGIIYTTFLACIYLNVTVTNGKKLLLVI